MKIAALVLATAFAGGVSAASGGPPEFQAKVASVRWADLRFTYHAGCPVTPPQLRTVEVSYWDFSGEPRVGRIVVARRVAAETVDVFRQLWAKRFPIRRLQPISAYHGDDDASMAADNTSGFNCRFVAGTKDWSMHAYGEAIDVNTVENPYVRGSTVKPPAGGRFLDRSRYRKGMAVRDGVLVRAFASVGWKWGASFGDYQHFSTTGR
jgi:hypothetical protein